MGKPTIDSKRLKAIATKYEIDEPSVVWKAYKGDIEEVKEADRVIVSKITSLAVDRDKEVVLPEGAVLDDYNGTVLWCHDYSPGDIPHARNLWVIPDSKKNPTYLKAATEYTPADINAFGERMFKYLAKWKGPMGKSIGFIPLESYTAKDGDAWERVLDNWKGRYSETKAASSQNVTDPERIYTKWALLEYSDVPVPANQDAIQEMKTKGLLTDEQVAEYVLKPETDEDYHRIPVRECKITATIPISESQGIDALYCGKEKKVHTYLFDKEKWTMDEAKAWVAEHDDGKGIEPVIIIMEPEDKADVIEKEGRVLSEKNRSLVKQCADMLMELHLATEPKREEPDDFDLEKLLDDPDPPEEINPQEIADIFNKAMAEIFKPSGEKQSKNTEATTTDDFDLDELPTPEEMMQLKQGKVL